MLKIFLRDTNPYLKLTEICNFLVSKRDRNFQFMWKLTSILCGTLQCSIHEEVGHSSYVWQIFERHLLHYFTAFIKCNINFFKGMCNTLKDFNYSSQPCVTILAKSHLVDLLEFLKSQAEIKYSFANFCVYLLKESTSSRQDFYKLVTNIPQLYQHQSNVSWKNYCIWVCCF